MNQPIATPCQPCGSRTGLDFAHSPHGGIRVVCQCGAFGPRTYDSHGMAVQLWNQRKGLDHG